MAQYPFKAESVKTYEQLRAGSYKCEIVKTDVMKTKDGSGRYISLQFKVKEGDFKGRSIFQRFNTLNRNPIAVEIAKKQLSILCHSIGIESFNDTDELLNYETIINLGEDNKLYGFNKIENNLEEKSQIIEQNDFTDDKIPF